MDVSKFDAKFFGISPLEAAAIDPQHRILLEVTYEALENSGIAMESIKGSDTSVFVATFTHDYENMMYKDSLSLPKYGMTGVGHALASNRISYILDLKGPSMTLDTGCSGSMVALHQACQSLRLGESTMSLVGGSNLILSPDTMIPMDFLHLLNSNGTCYSFDSRGSGYGRGEGAAILVLKRLDEAILAGDPIRAVIRNTAIGQDGRTAGITFPNGESQQSLIRSAYAATGIDPSRVGLSVLSSGFMPTHLRLLYILKRVDALANSPLLVKAHGTGTVAGDLTEVEALGKVFCNSRVATEPLYIGSIKVNIGHLESTSGLAGVIKTILILEKGLIPGTPQLSRYRNCSSMKFTNA